MAELPNHLNHLKHNWANVIHLWRTCFKIQPKLVDGVWTEHCGLRYGDECIDWDMSVWFSVLNLWENCKGSRWESADCHHLSIKTWSMLEWVTVRLNESALLWDLQRLISCWNWFGGIQVKTVWESVENIMLGCSLHVAQIQDSL